MIISPLGILGRSVWQKAVLVSVFMFAGGYMAEQEANAAPSPVLTLRESLAARPHVLTRSEDGWTIFEDDANRTIWSFVPDTNPAFPAVVKR